MKIQLRLTIEGQLIGGGWEDNCQSLIVNGVEIRCNSPIYENEEMQIKHYPYKKFGRDDMEKVETRHYCWRCKDGKSS